jgi:hypothetical protein
MLPVVVILPRQIAFARLRKLEADCRASIAVRVVFNIASIYQY